MRKFAVVFEMQNEYGEWFKDSLSNDGHGFRHDEAESVKHQLYENNLGLVRNVKVVMLQEVEKWFMS